MFGYDNLRGMPRSTPTRISTRQSRRHSPISTSSSESVRRKALEPLRSPDGTPLPGILADSDTALKNLNKSEAQKVVNESIRDAVISITNGPPRILLQRVCWKNHPMRKLQPMVGHTDYTEIGRYYTMVRLPVFVVYICNSRSYSVRLAQPAPSRCMENLYPRSS
jgi:hypothetical protein